jgi:hypothetical protein
MQALPTILTSSLKAANGSYTHAALNVARVETGGSVFWGFGFVDVFIPILYSRAGRLSEARVLS